MAELLTRAEAKADLKWREAARQDIYSYVRYMRKSGLPDFQYKSYEHHRLILDFCQKMADGGEGDHDRLLLNMPPGAAKSTWLTVIYVTWLLARNPSDSVLVVCNSQKLSEEFSRRRRIIMLDDRWQSVSGSQLAPDAQSLEYLATVHQGYIRSTAVGGIVTGTRCRHLVIDDPVAKQSEVTSPEQADKTFLWYESEAKTRLLPGGCICIIMTRWGKMDLAGKILDRVEKGEEDWTHISLPIVSLGKDIDPLKRPRGARLWPQHYTDRMVTEAQRDPVLFRSLWMQDPPDSEGEWMDPTLFKTVVDAPENLKYAIGVDLATGSAVKGDCTAMVTIGIDEAGDVYVVDVVNERITTDVAADKLIALCRQYNPTAVCVESDLISQTWEGLLKEKALKSGVFPKITLMRHGGRDKLARASALAGYLNMGKIKFLARNWTDEMFKQCLAFPAGRYDDLVDSLGTVIRRVHKLGVAQKPPPPKPIQTALQIGPNGVIQCRGTLDDLFEDNERDTRRYEFEKLRIGG